MRMTAVGALLMLATAAATATAQEDLSSRRDYSDNAQRDLPIACKAGDNERVPGKSLGDVFGEEWPAQPEASSPEARTGAKIIEHGPIRWPRGLDPQNAFTVVAVLVDAGGKPLRAEILCSTRTGFDKTVRNHAMADTYAPAVIDGKPVTSVMVQVVSVRMTDHQGPAKPLRRF
jgi:hypothetical protein